MSERPTLDSLFKLVHMLKRNLHEQIEGLDLTITPMHIRVLKIINYKPECTAVDIAAFMQRDKAQITRLLSTLITQELIMKAPHPNDKRSQCLRITSSGHGVMDKIAEIDKTIFEKMSQDLSEQDLAEFERIAGRMVKNLDF